MDDGGPVMVGSFTQELMLGPDTLVSGTLFSGTDSRTDSRTGDDAPPSPKAFAERDIFVARLGMDLLPAWARRFGGEGPDTANAVAIDGAGDIVVAASHTATLYFGGEGATSQGGFDALLIKLDAAGELVWWQSFGRNEDDGAFGLAIDADDSVIVSGTFQTAIKLSGPVLHGVGAEDVFVTKLAP
jgi:hypothetical protein